MQNYKRTLHVIGVLLMIFSISMLPPIAVTLYYHDDSIIPFVVGFIATFGVGLFLWWFCPTKEEGLTIRDGFLIVFLFWVILSLFGTIPFILTTHTNISFTDAMFESVSALTTTGATIFAKASALPHDILYYRQQLQLMGGLGVIVFAVAILPMLGVGGMQLFRAEITGPVKNTKLSPRMSGTAKSLWKIYLSMAVIAAICFKLAGMNLFDAICESFSVVSTGGLTIHTNSFAFYKNGMIDFIAVVFMLLSSINYCLHYNFLTRGKISSYFQNSEFRMFFAICAIASFLIAIWLSVLPHNPAFFKNLQHAAFTTISVATTTGITTSRFSSWPIPITFLLMIIAMIGGCSGSTSGGIKIIRLVVLAKQGLRELKQILHPQAVITLKVDNEPLSDKLSSSIWAFLALFVVLFIVLWLILLATGLDVTTAFGALAACISNCGASIGGVAQTYEHIGASAKWVLIFTMLTGRLEIFTVLVLFTRDFWRR